MNRLDDIISTNKKILNSKKLIKIREKLSLLPDSKFNISIDDTIAINADNNIDTKLIDELILELKPWRIGPYKLFDTFIDSEWKSYMKLNTILQAINIKDKNIADVGCQNGYFMFQFISKGAKSVTGFDPSAFFYTQFNFLNHFIKSNIDYQLFGVENMPLYNKKFDLIFCMGVLYHRMDPISTLKSLKTAMLDNSKVILDTLILDRKDDLVLFPKNTTYAKMPNVYYIPSINALKSWVYKAGFKKFEIIDIVKTTTKEQRVTEFSGKESLKDFLSSDQFFTKEGYPAPLRVYATLSN